MYAFHSTIVCKLGLADDYQARATDPTQGLFEAEGFQRRLLLRSRKNIHLFFHVSSWRDELDAVAFRNSDHAVKWRVGRDLSVYIEQMRRTPVTILHDFPPSAHKDALPSDQDHFALSFDDTGFEGRAALDHLRGVMALGTAMLMRGEPAGKEIFLIQAPASLGVPETAERLSEAVLIKRTSCQLVADDHSSR